jgi:outer membrane protein TolC
MWIVKVALNRPYTFIVLALLILILSKETDGWKLAQPSDHLPKGRWWEIFGDPELQALLEEVAAANQNLKIAEARLREARAIVRVNRAALFPTISAGLGASAIRDSANRPFLTPNAPGGSSGDLLLFRKNTTATWNPSPGDAVT